MAGKNFKIPPTFTEESCYEVWKNEIEMWKLVTDLGKKKQALAVALSLAGKPREVALEIPTSVLNADDGVDKLIEKLDGVFLTEEHENSYVAYSSFENFKKEPDVNMCDFIIEFERRYNKTKKFKMVLPDPVLAFKLLDSCNLNNSEKQLALTAASDSSYSAMKGALRRVFGEKLCYSKPTDCIRIKQEPECAYYTQQRRSRYRPRQQFNRYHQSPNKGTTFGSPNGKTNPLNKYGEPSRCSICQSIMHWRKDCPHDKSEEYEIDETETCNFTLLAKELSTQYDVLTIESLGTAVIDTACTRTVCGEKWFNNFVENMRESDRYKMKIIPSRKVFKFGDGKTVKSCKSALIPVIIGHKNCDIQTEVVKADIPLLLSKESLQKAETILDLKNDRAIMFGKPVQLELTSTGHYCISISGEKYFSGENVYYRRPDSYEWNGPATVIGQERDVIFVRHEGAYVRVHQSRLQKLSSHSSFIDSDDSFVKFDENDIEQPKDSQETLPTESETVAEMGSLCNDEYKCKFTENSYSIIDDSDSSEHCPDNIVQLKEFDTVSEYSIDADCEASVDEYEHTSTSDYIEEKFECDPINEKSVNNFIYALERKCVDNSELSQSSSYDVDDKKFYSESHTATSNNNFDCG